MTSDAPRDPTRPTPISHNPSFLYWVRAGFGIGLGLMLLAVPFSLIAALLLGSLIGGLIAALT